ncbi:LppU/SCO3897 family protein [Micromonospora sp. CA-111912]|uniref:LppU/SCO3897 family protein n=1 Tax=Micromonospora sp. CA-111912 TaxID=3239955 RepID=UPI003D919DC2
MPEQVAPPPNPPSEDAPRPADPPAAAKADPSAAAGQAVGPPSAAESAAAGQPAAGLPVDSASAPAGLPVDAAPAAELPKQPEGEPEKKRSVGRKVLGVVGVLLAVGVVAALKFGVGSAVATAFDKDGTADAKTGDCLAELPDVAEGERKDASGAEVVACTSSQAAYTVVGRVNGQTETQARTGKACEPFLQPGQEGYFFYNIKPGSTGYLLCLTRKAA